jgi:uncharacterized protein YndB with AHSA1/START domain
MRALPIGFLFGIVMPISAALAAPMAVTDSSFREANGHRVLQLSTIVQASQHKVWLAFATDEGRKTWAVPVERMTLANDGIVESSYETHARIGVDDNIQNKIVTYLPERLLAMQNLHVPKGAPFDPILIASIRTIIQLDAVDATHTRVTVSQVGYGEGAGYDDMHRHFHDGNAYELNMLAQRFVAGPVNWTAREAARANASLHKSK